MPVDVVGLIIDRSEYKQQLKLRKTSKSLRALVDKHKPACKSVEVYCCMKSVDITFNNQWVMYRSLDSECEPYTRIIVKRDDFMKVAFDDLASTLKNPKLQLEEFVVYNEGESSEKYCNEIIRNVLESLNHQVSVRKVDCHSSISPCMLSILPFLKPGFLEIISLDANNADWSGDATGIDQVALLDQWKQAKQLELWNCFDSIPLKYATHFKRLHVCQYDLDLYTFDRIKDFLSKLQNFEYCRIEQCCRNNINDVQRMTGIPVPPNMSHYLIPDSDYCLEFSIAANDITIVKKMCHLH